MLKSLTIKNYALIDDLNVEFNNGLSIITGETGAGKSILLGALGLVLGNRADLSVLKTDTDKCVIEAQFAVENYNLESVFKQNDLDYERLTIIRREILPSGKSRAFVNDTPTNLSSLKALGDLLIDVHSQNETLQLTESDFQLQILDALAGNKLILERYSQELKQYKLLKKELHKLLELQEELQNTHKYNLFLLTELEKANLSKVNYAELEENYNALSNVETLKEHLALAYNIFSSEDKGLLDLMLQIKQELQKASAISAKYENIAERIESIQIDLDDIFSTLEIAFEDLESNPEELEKLSESLQLLNSLFKKHAVNSIEELVAIEKQLSDAVNQVESIEGDIKKTEKLYNNSESELKTLSQELNNLRTEAIPKLTEQLQSIVAQLGMPNATFKIQLETSETFLKNGTDNIQFFFSANKGGQLQALKKAASGGERSRIMLAVKAILSRYIKLPSIIFDEIDTGVSGEIANKMGDIMKQMSANMQIISITHLAQIAAKGHTHYKVYKLIEDNKTHTQLEVLNPDQRVEEIAQMIDGKTISESAMAHARQLLN